MMTLCQLRVTQYVRLCPNSDTRQAGEICTEYECRQQESKETANANQCNRMRNPHIGLEFSEIWQEAMETATLSGVPCTGPEARMCPRSARLSLFRRSLPNFKVSSPNTHILGEVRTRSQRSTTEMMNIIAHLAHLNC